MSEQVHISDSLRHLDRVILPEFERAQDALADELRDAWKASLEDVGAIRTRAYYRAVDVRAAQVRAGVRERMIDDEGINYSDIVERGRRNNPSGRGGYPGRFPVKQAIEQSAGVIESELDSAGARVQRKFD